MAVTDRIVCSASTCWTVLAGRCLTSYGNVDVVYIRRSEDFDLPGSVTSYVWLFAGLDHFAPYNCFHWSITRSHSVADDCLAAFRGTVIADGYDAYAQLEKRTEGRIVHPNCNAHARRESTKAEIYEPVLRAEATILGGSALLASVSLGEVVYFLFACKWHEGSRRLPGSGHLPLAAA
jgi:hypothetical protein